MKRKLFIIGILLLSLLFFSPKQYKVYADTEPNLSAKVSDNFSVHLLSNETSAQASTTQNGFKYWGTEIRNNGATPVTNPTITVMSGYDPSIFDSISAFPVISTQPNLAPGDSFGGSQFYPNDAVDENTVPPSYSTPVNFTLGYDSSRTASPESIPVGGTHQTVTLTLKPIDTLSGPNASYHIEMYSIVQGVTLISETDPTNLDQGEQISGGSDPNKLWYWDLSGLQLNKQYTFTVVLNVPNASGSQYDFRPVVRIGSSWDTIPESSVSPSSFVTVTDPTLDGPMPGVGNVTYSVAETDHLWVTAIQNGREVLYEGTQPPDMSVPTSKDQCKKGGWKNFGMGPTGMFKNQGDCVSYVATHGKNPSSGGQ